MFTAFRVSLLIFMAVMAVYTVTQDKKSYDPNFKLANHSAELLHPLPIEHWKEFRVIGSLIEGRALKAEIQQHLIDTERLERQGMQGNLAMLLASLLDIGTLSLIPVLVLAYSSRNPATVLTWSVIIPTSTLLLLMHLAGNIYVPRHMSGMLAIALLSPLTALTIYFLKRGKWQIPRASRVGSTDEA